MTSCICLLTGGFEISEHYAGKLRKGNSFRDWLVKQMGDRIRNKNCAILEFRITPSSHKVCRYEFEGGGISVMAKFFGKPTGNVKKYDAHKAMLNEYRILKKLKNIICVSKAIAVSGHFDCVLVTEYISGKPFSWYLRNEKDIDGKLKSIAFLLRRLHRHTHTYYRKDQDFAKFKKTLRQLHPGSSTRKRYSRRLKSWWKNPLLDEKHGCMIHHDTQPANYVFHKGKVYAIDFELYEEHGYFAHDLGVLCAEVFNHFALKGEAYAAIPHIKRFLRNYSRDEKEYKRAKQVLPLYLSYGLLRIARRRWHPEHRDYLINEALDLLRRPAI